ncbi:helix-turn-helix domain-containing protein (plasmid) [Saccharothrix sp. AJ9571]|nr:helix-turn-helix domain-containing protein [Saccharothrix sp. AJ9571]
MTTPTSQDVRRAQLAHQLRTARIGARLSQERAAAALPRLGRSALSDIERARRDVSALELTDLATAYAVEVSELLGATALDDHRAPNLAGLTDSELDELRNFAAFLRWRRSQTSRTS